METELINYVNEEFDKNVLPSLMEYIRIPNLTPDYDPEWETNGHAQKACDHIVSWIKAQDLQGCKIEVIKDPGMTHLITVEIEGTKEVAFMYAHWDKQPFLEGLWRKGLGPLTPVVEGDLLYGRGSADDGYGSYAAILSIKACQKMKLPHPTIFMVLESCEESGKDDFPYYLEKLMKTRLKKIDYVVCLDSSAVSTDRLWMTSSLRGIITLNLTVKVLKDPVHSGEAGGIIPESFRICRILMDRLEKDGKLIEDLHTKIPEVRVKEAEELAKVLKETTYTCYPFLPGVRPESEDVKELILNNYWRPSLAVTGADGLPAIEKAGNVHRTFTTLRVSIRIPPYVDCKKASEKITEILNKDPPYNAVVEGKCVDGCDGWNANEFSPELDATIKKISKDIFGCEYGTVGVGGSIPFVALLGEKFPNAVFFVTGAATSTSAEHSPNENLNIVYTKKFISALTLTLAATAKAK